MTVHTPRTAPRLTRSHLRMAFAAALLGTLCACAAGDPTGSSVKAPAGAHFDDDNGGIMGSGYAKPDTTTHP
ncbi:MAG TPA: hypothetical protein VFH27_11750 [Longimicrobiaceae bacterium]|nr:hypothetical protein [Longimicrobiaceae bacterium]